MGLPTPTFTHTSPQATEGLGLRGAAQESEESGCEWLRGTSGGLAASWDCRHPQCLLAEAEEAFAWGTAHVSGLFFQVGLRLLKSK